jgi:tRNA threonylcarbamoyl adenosine modification protein (Sua5/YciO/YrdC/YwlC family)
MAVQQARILPFRSPDDADAIREASEALARGEVVVVPTETVYGVAVHPGAPGALDRLYALKTRDANKPVALLAAGLDDVTRHGAVLGSTALRLAQRFWPGPLTMVLDVGGADGAPPASREGFRVPGHEALCALLAATGCLRVTSANRSGRPPAHTVAEALAALGEGVGLVLDGGVCDGTPSTVVRVEGDDVSVLREGALPAAEILGA